ncbi:GntR family transcriptional regulator [Bailinhaonella thermotolerans]|uniref:GntR family transcriptional regulator n=1 Tax=Bailinhaonella thermotolerans TaxID=1070861 RepID=A0A3A4AUK5_9ACTN|nr:GntR family transcriptional regulator [Bailinhaonella thermotolerans]RJL31004.1 GntR family transcriptional regulator [Bailinhaonella thermotolerans]
MTGRRHYRPRYLQVAEDLRDEILRGDLAAGDPLPGEPVLAERYHLSRTSVRDAIKLLRDWGLVRAEPGRGTRVRTQRQRVRRTPERYQWEKDRVRLPEHERRTAGATEKDTGLKVDDLEFHAEYSTVEAGADLAERFQVPVGTRLLHRVYWTSSVKEGAALTLARSWLVYDVAAANPDLLDAANEPWPGGTQHQLHTLGIEVDHVIDEITARPPQPDEAHILDIGPGVSVLVLRKTSVDTEGRVAEVAETVLPGDRTELVYTTRLERWSG